MKIELLDGTEIDIAEYSLGVEDYNIPSVEIEHQTAVVDGLDNQIVTDTRFTGRTISVVFCYVAKDHQNYILLRNQLNGLFARKTPFYIRFKDDSTRRWMVRLASQFVTEKELETVGSMSIDFRCEKLYAESVTASNYTFNTANFIVKNTGTETVDPRESQLDITLKGVFAKQVKMTNKTTGDVFIFTGALTANDTLKLTGVRTLKNGVSALKNTNKKLITIASGDNDFLIEGGTVSSIVFNFRSLYM